MEPDPVVRVRENVAFSNKFITVYDDPVSWPDGTRGNYLRIVESDGRPGVAMLPLAGDRIGLVKTYRYPLGEWEWSIPRGFGDFAAAEQSARSELVEELGEEPESLVSLGAVAPNSGLLSAKVQLFLAHYPATVSAPVDQREIHDVRWPTIAEVRQEIATGRITDGFTLSAFCLALLTDQLG